jgi:5-hydroxytryptamine receptor 1
MIAIVWFVAMSISIPSIFLFKDDNDPTITGICMISQNHVYTIFSTVGAFYLPTVLMLIIYAKIFVVARQRIRKKRFAQKKQFQQKQKNRESSPTCNNTTEMTLLTVPRKDSPVSRSEISEMPLNGSSGSGEHDDNENKCKTNGHLDSAQTAMLPKTSHEILKAKKQKEKLEMKRERKAARTLAIITGAFIICWLPFFILAIMAPFIRSQVHIPLLVESITLWLGYCNSLLNPIIYTVFNPEFRIAFQKILFGKYARKYRRNTR